MGLIDTPTLQSKKFVHLDSLNKTSLSPPPSSPPLLVMALISSPIAYPPSSSPPFAKKNKVAHNWRRNTPKLVGGFLVDEEEDDVEPPRTPPTVNILPTVPKDDSVSEPAPTHTNSSERIDQAISEPTQNNTIPPVVSTESQDEEILPWLSVEQYQYKIASSKKRFSIRTCAGSSFPVKQRQASAHLSFEQLIASRSSTEHGRATKSYYGIDIHNLMDETAQHLAKDPGSAYLGESINPILSTETRGTSGKERIRKRALMWTEKYRAKRYADLVGDERTHRSVLGWLKSWDPIVFPGYSRTKPSASRKLDTDEPSTHRKVLLVTGPPGLGKTTLAHVCARQAGYDVLEINASDERSRDVVKGRIRDIVGTESVKSVATTAVDGKSGRAARPVCVVLDEVDGAVSGAGGSGEGGFIKALIDLIMLDQRTSAASNRGAQQSASSGKRNNKTHKESFRLMRPIILVCNDLYHPALRPLRQSTLAQVIHVRKPLLNQVIPRIHAIFENEGFRCDGDGVRKLCEAAWGVSGRRDSTSYSGNVEGDLRGVLVVAEWVATKFRASELNKTLGLARLTREWVERHITGGLSHGGAESRGVGRGGVKEAVERVFLEGAGFQRSTAVTAGQERLQGQVGSKLSITEMTKRNAMQRLGELVDSSGEIDRVVTGKYTKLSTL